jgi:hypothetical protein
MNNKQIQIWIAVVAGLALAALLLLASSATASLPEPDLALPDPVTSNAGASRAAQAASGWSSGWITITPGTVETLTHDLGGDTDEYAVELWSMDTDEGGYGINARAYGGLEAGGSYYGAAWQHLTSNTIQVVRFADDTFADRVRVRVWVPDPLPEYCSDWTSIALSQTLVFTHSLGGDVDDYVVGMAFSNTLRGISNFAYGGLEINSGDYRGAYWHDLTTSTVRVFRFPGGLPAAQLRICVTRPDPPDYDSGWVTVTQDTTRTFAHNLRLNPNLYLVRLHAKSDDSSFGINNVYAGGMDADGSPRGTNWQNSTANSIDVFRRSQDEHADQVRLRIWVRGHRIYLPLALKNCAPEMELAYDDGSAESEQSYNALDSGFAVLFTTPGASAQLVRARYYFNTAASDHPIQVHVWDANRSDLITPFTATPPTGAGWLEVDLSSYNLTVSGDFYVGFLYSEQHSDPSLGVDSSGPDGRSYEVPWIEMTNLDYMIRAVIVP